jgi:hypothetical protein
MLAATVLPSKWSVTPMTVTAGFTLAMLVERKHFNIAMQRGPGQAVAQYLSGAPGLFLIFFAFKPLISRIPPPIWHLFLLTTPSWGYGWGWGRPLFSEDWAWRQRKQRIGLKKAMAQDK